LQRGKPYIQLYGSKVDLQPFVDQAVMTVVPKALSNMKQQMRFLDGEAIDFVLIGGGGGNCYSAAAKEIFPLSKILPAAEPVISNAFGYWLNH
jgi:plasmid segregation protein ParM